MKSKTVVGLGEKQKLEKLAAAIIAAGKEWKLRALIWTLQKKNAPHGGAERRKG